MSRPAAYGLAGALLLYFTFGVLNVFAVPLFRPDDEPRHAAYALEVAGGRLPRVTETVPTERLGIEPLKTNIMAAANHPPLYYAIVGVPILWGSETGHMAAGMYLARLITLAMGAVGIVYSFFIFRLLLPERPAIAVLATALLGTFPSFVNYCSLVHNDALAFTSATALLFYLVQAFVRGWTRADIAWFAGWAAIVGLTRFSGILVLAPAIGALMLVPWFHEPDRTGERVLSGLKVVAITLAAVLITSGWFYWRNYEMYGDVTGAAELLDVLDRKTRKSAFFHLFQPRPWGILHDHLWERLGGVWAFFGSIDIAVRAFTTGAVLGLGLSAWRMRWSRDLLRDPRVWAFGVGVAALAAVILPVFEFYSRGGNIYPRYYFPVLWVPALAAAVGYSSFRSSFPAMWAIGYQVLLAFAIFFLYLETLFGFEGQPRDFIMTTAFSAKSNPAGQVLSAAILVALPLGVTLVVRSIADQYRPAVDPD